MPCPRCRCIWWIPGCSLLRGNKGVRVADCLSNTNQVRFRSIHHQLRSAGPWNTTHPPAEQPHPCYTFMQKDDDSVTLRVKVFGGNEAILLLLVSPQDTLESVARQVRKAQEWGPEQHMRFIAAGQELFMDDSVSKAVGSVIHCIASQCPAQKFPAPKTGNGHKGAQSPAVDWLEVVEPGAVLMWIFGSILTLLWLLFVCYAHMFDRTSVIMLCMMTIAFLIPCVLSYAPALRLLHFPGFISPAPRHMSGYDVNRAQYSVPEAPAGGGWAAYSTGGSYAGAIPPRPAARVRPGTHPPS